MRIASWNVRVDHHEDIETVHDWPMRRALVSSSLRALSADIVALQEPSPAQAADIKADLGPEWGVLVTPCDPNAWEAEPETGPQDGQARDGNGVMWRRSRVDLVDTYTFWLSPSPEAPWPGAEGAYGGSIYQRSCVACTFVDKDTGQKIGVFSTHFDHEGDDNLATGGSDARRQSAAHVMSRANDMLSAGSVDYVVVCGDFNTFEDRYGATYSSLVSAADGNLFDVRDVPGVMELDGGRGSGSWEGWETNPWNRAAAGDQRYDQLFVSTSVGVLRTTVLEEKYCVPFNGEYAWVYASDHAPVVADLALPLSKSGKARLTRRRRALGLSASLRAPMTPRELICLGTCAAFTAALLGVFLWLLWDLFAANLECRFQCRSRSDDPPFDAGNATVGCATD